MTSRSRAARRSRAHEVGGRIPLRDVAPAREVRSIREIHCNDRYTLRPVGPRAMAAWCLGGTEGYLSGPRAMGVTARATNYRDRHEDGFVLFTLYPDEVAAAPIEGFFLADGMGGRPAGHLASGLTLQQVLTRIVRDYFGQSSFEALPPLIASGLAAARAMLPQLRSKGDLHAPNTTFLAGLRQGARGCFLHLGDSPAVAIADDPTELLALAEPHLESVERHRVEHPEASLDQAWLECAGTQAAGNPRRSVLKGSIPTITSWDFGERSGWVMGGSDGGLGNWGPGNLLCELATVPDSMPFAARLVPVAGALQQAMPQFDYRVPVQPKPLDWPILDTRGHRVAMRPIVPDNLTVVLQRVAPPVDDGGILDRVRQRLTALLPRQRAGAATRRLDRLEATRHTDIAWWLNHADSADALRQGLRIMGVLPR